MDRTRSPRSIAAGVLCCIAIVIIDRRPAVRLLAGGVGVWFLGQGVLTFSRGGSVNLIVAALAALPFLVGRARDLIRIVLTLLAVAAFLSFIFIPVMQATTGGEFATRFTSSNTTLRGELMRAELSVWRENPVFGVGVGMADLTAPDPAHPPTSGQPPIPTHNEFSRLLADHGLLGLFALLLIVGIALMAILRQRNALGRAFSVALFAWCASEVLHSATRLAIVPFLFAFATVLVVEEVPRSDGPAQARDSMARQPARRIAGVEAMGDPSVQPL